MTRAILILTTLFWSATAVLAQDRLSLHQPLLESPSAAVQAPAPPAQRPSPPPPPTTVTKRLASMVGYIDDALVESHVRLRVDAATGNARPDRAEFFYAKCGCYQGLVQAIPAAFDPNAPGPGPGVPTTLNFQQLFVEAEYAPTSRFAAFVELPARWIQPQAFQAVPPFPAFSSQGGLADIRVGVKAALLRSPTSALTAQLRAFFPSGDASKGLGTDHGSVEPALLYYRQISDRLALESEVGVVHPTGGSAGVPTASSDKFSGDVIFYGIGPSYEIYSHGSFRVAPVIELVGWSVRGGFETQPGGPILGAAVDAGGTNIVNLKIGGRITSGDRSSVYAGYGRVLTDAAWYNNIVRLEYRYGF